MPGPIPIKISTRSGVVTVTCAPDTDLSVDGGVIVERTEAGVDIRRERNSGSITVRCPSGTDLKIGTNSGGVEVSGEAGAVRIATASGKIRVEHATSVDVRTKSGKIDIGVCEGECRIVTASANVHVGSADRVSIVGVSGLVLCEKVWNGGDVKTVSGKVLLGAAGVSSVSVHTVSGKVEIRVPNELRPATRLKSVSGKIVCDYEPGADGEISVKTISGRINVSSG